jgi:hypothetical protein
MIMAGGPTAASWLGLVRLFDPNGTKRSLSALPETAGVYRIRALKADEQPVPLRRLKCDDPEGILDIGKTAYLRWRIGEFQKAVLDGKTYHSAGLTFHNYPYRDLFSLETLCVDWLETPNEEAARDLERQRLKDYRSRFLDFPPLNLKH